MSARHNPRTEDFQEFFACAALIFSAASRRA
jgi:hypothetical protein